MLGVLFGRSDLVPPCTPPFVKYVERRHFARQNDVCMSKLLVWFSVGLRRRRRIFLMKFNFRMLPGKIILKRKNL